MKMHYTLGKHMAAIIRTARVRVKQNNVVVLLNPFNLLQFLRRYVFKVNQKMVHRGSFCL